MSDKIEIHEHKDWDIAFHFFRLGRFEEREGTFEIHFQDYLNEIISYKECKCFRLKGSNEPFQTYLCEIHKPKQPQHQ
jgi:hypothetical protein